MKKQKLSSLLPIAVFLIFYLGLGIWSEYIMKIPMGFYNIPIVVAFMLAILKACFQKYADQHKQNFNCLLNYLK